MRLGVLLVFSLAGCAQPMLRFVPSPVGVAVETDSGLFAEYRTDGRRGPVLWPLCAVGGATLTRAFPFAEVEGERCDHPHHESCWFAHGDINGVDCWAGDGSIVATGEPVIDVAHAVISQQCEWRDKEGAVLCHDCRRWKFCAAGCCRSIDVEVELWRDDGELRVGDTKEGSMALRLRNEFCLDGPGAAGTVCNSEGLTGNAVWGQPARWVAYSADLGGVPHTVAMFDAPNNHGHPTHWHARGYGL
ncbi:MAG: PmoA family protein, partial [Planctomycetes bacterium]|nr:PmoA family protein [Planctomycetota bacterium]